jgi:signal transduction histidine kinase/CheY-like chemotaxis protein
METDRPLSVLLVEDHPAVARDLQELLRAQPAFQVTWVATLAAALDHLQAATVDCALLDLNLPDSQGLDTLTRIVRDHPSLPIVVLTAHDEQLAGAALHAGAQDYLRKDTLDVAMLVRALRYALERNQGAVALRTRTAQLDTVRIVANELVRELDLTRLLRLIVEQAARLMGATSGTCFLWEAASRLLVPQAWIGYDAWRAHTSYPPGSGIAGLVAQLREGVVTTDYSAEPYADQRVLGRQPICAVMGEPLLYRDRLIGVVTLDYDHPRAAFTPDERDLLRVFATQAAIALENARLHAAAVRRGAELETLLAATRSVMSGLDLQEILDRIVAEAHRISGAPHVKIVLLDRAAGVLRVGAARGTAHAPGDTMPLESGLSSHVVRTGEPLYIARCAEDPRNRKAARDRALGMQAYLGLPITRGGTILGVLTFNTTTPRAFSPDELAFLTAFADQAAIAIENARLFAELHDSYARLQAAQTELVRSEKLRGLGQMAAGIAHDLNNTLAAILGQAELMRLRGVPLPLQENLRTLETAASDGAQVVRRLQDFARQRGSVPLISLALPPVIQEALDLTGPRWKDEVQRRGHTIQLHVALDGLPPILGHPSEIREALTNLIFNAVDAMPEGGILTVTGTSTPTEVCLHVRDTGIGMPEAVRQKVFEPFFTTKGVKGTGLGLSVVYGIMERHGGRVDVTSTPGRGSTFTLRFQPAPAAPDGVASDMPPAGTMARRLLVIDDDPLVRRTLTALLQAAGQTVLAADSGPAGLALLIPPLPDLVLTDLGMPEMSGLEVAQRVKAIHPRLPVVLLTGWGDTAMLAETDPPCVDRVLGKPVRLAELLRLVTELTGSAENVD